MEPWYLNWEMWGAIGQWAGAIATVAAVWVALQQTREARDAIRPSLELVWALIEEEKEYLVVRAVNQKPISIYVMNVHSLIIFENDHGSIRVPLPQTFMESDIPQSLPPGNFLICKISLTDLVLMLKDYGLHDKSGFYLRVIFRDSLYTPYTLNLFGQWFDDGEYVGMRVWEQVGRIKGYKPENADNVIKVVKDE
jgi:hypothetical protein